MTEWSPFMREIFAEHAAWVAKRPHLVVSHEPAREENAVRSGAPVDTSDQTASVRSNERAGAPTHQLTLVHDADALARDIANIGKLAIARIKETLGRPFNPGDPNYQALLRFTSGVYNSTMTTMLRADENLLRARAVDRLPELLERVAEEERKRLDRRRGIDVPPDGA